MPTIASLSAVVSANTSQFQGAMERTAKTLGNLENKVVSMQSPFTRFQSLLATIGVVAIVAYISHVVHAKIETLRFARSIGDTVHGIDVLSTALRQSGSDGDKARQVLANLNKTLASGATGNAAIADVFRRIGLDVAALNRLTPSQAFWIIADQISRIADAQQRAAIASVIFGDDAEYVIGVLTRGENAAAEAAKNVDRFGRAVSDIEISAIEAASIKFDDMRASIEAVALKIAVQLGPFILKMADNIQEFADRMGKANSQTSGLVKSLAYAWFILNNAYQAVKLVVQMIGIAFTLLIYLGAKAIRNMVELAEKVHRMLGRLSPLSDEFFRDWHKGIKGIEDDSRSFGKTLADGIKNTIDKGVIGYDDIMNQFNMVGREAEKAGKKIDGMARAGGSLKDVSKYGAVFQKGLQITNDNLTPFQKFNSTMTELDFLLRSQAISWDTYGRAVAKAAVELENAYNLRSLSLPNALRYGSGQDVSAFNKAKLEFDTRVAETPAQRLERLQKQALDVHKQQLDYSRQLADAAKNRKVYDIK